MPKLINISYIEKYIPKIPHLNMKWKTNKLNVLINKPELISFTLRYLWLWCCLVYTCLYLPFCHAYVQCTNDMTFFISADTDNHRYNPIFISADTDKLPIQFFLYRPIPITDITSFIIYTFFIMITRKIILKWLSLCQLVVDRTREKNYPYVFRTLDFYILQNKVKQCSISS